MNKNKNVELLWTQKELNFLQCEELREDQMIEENYGYLSYLTYERFDVAI